MKIQYLLDEHIASVYRTQLMRQSPDGNEYQDRIEYLPLSQ